MFVPVRTEAGELRPFHFALRVTFQKFRRAGRDRSLHVGELRRRNRVVRKPAPIANQDHGHGHELSSQRPLAEQIQQGITQADLREHIHEREVGLLRAVRRQKHSQRDQHERSPQHMPKSSCGRLTFTRASRIRKRQRHADQKHEARLDQVPEPAPRPRDVIELVRENVEQPQRNPIRPRLAELVQVLRLDQLREPKPARCHREHHKPAISVDRHHPVGGRTLLVLRHGNLSFTQT